MTQEADTAVLCRSKYPCSGMWGLFNVLIFIGMLLTHVACCRISGALAAREVSHHGQPVRTLSQRDAMVQACCHATTDRWMALRNLVDIERIGRALPSAHQVDLSRLRPVRKSLQVIADAFEENRASWSVGRAHAVRLKAEVAQQRPWRSMGDGGWTKTNRLRYFAHVMNLSHHPVHVCSMLLQQLMPPEDLVDQQTGEVRSLWQVMLWRGGKLGSRFRGQAESPDQPA